MENIKKIVCFCGSGLGSSFMMEMNCKKALKNLGIQGVSVEHTTLADVHKGMADLLICGNDLLPQAQKAGKAIGLKNLVSLPEMTEKLKKEFGLLISRKNPEYFDISSAVSSPLSWSMTPNQGTIFGKDKMKYTTVTDARFGTAEKLPVHQIMKFGMVVEDLTNWIGFGIRAQNSPTALGWGGNGQYLFIILIECDDHYQDTVLGQTLPVSEYDVTDITDSESVDHDRSGRDLAADFRIIGA